MTKKKKRRLEYVQSLEFWQKMNMLHHDIASLAALLLRLENPSDETTRKRLEEIVGRNRVAM